MRIGVADALEIDPGDFDNLAGREKAGAIEQELQAALIEWMVVERDYLPLPIVLQPSRPVPRRGPLFRQSRQTEPRTGLEASKPRGKSP